MIKISSPASPRTADEVAAHLTEHVAGRQVAFTDHEIRDCVDWSRVRKAYKLNGAPAVEALPEGSPDRVRESEMLALTAMALRALS